MASQTFTTSGEAVLAALLAGLSEADAARQHGVAVRTVQRWLERGREDPDSAYGSFARAVDGARADRALPDELPADEGELLLVASRAARKGNVQAMRLVWEMLKVGDEGGEAGADDPLREVDELARRRMAAIGGGD